MLKKRLIACLPMIDGRVVQSYRFERHLPIGSPRAAIENLNRWGVDEIVLTDIRATAQGRLVDLDRLTPQLADNFIPLTIGGGVRTLDDIKRIIRGGADKVCLNSAAFATPELITEGARAFGIQCIVVSIDAIRDGAQGYRVYSRAAASAASFRGTLSPVEWAKRLVDLGAGEIFLNSVDRDGTANGFELPLIEAVARAVPVPVIACGGAGEFSHIAKAFEAGADAVAVGNLFQHRELCTRLAKEHLVEAGLPIRKPS